MPNNMLITTQPVFKSYQYNFVDLQGTSGAGAKTFTIDTLPQGSVLLYIRVKHSVAFVGTSLTGLTLTVGKVGGTVTTFVSTPFEMCSAAVADGTLSETWTPAMGQLSAVSPTITFTPTGAYCSVCTAGIVNIDVLYAPALTPTFSGLYSSGTVL